MKKQVKVDPETRSYDFLTKTREKNPMLRNVRKLEVTLGLRMKIEATEKPSARFLAQPRILANF